MEGSNGNSYQQEYIYFVFMKCRGLFFIFYTLKNENVVIVKDILAETIAE